MKKLKSILSALAVLGIVGSASAFTRTFGSTAIYCKNGSGCVYSGYQSAATVGGQTTIPCGAGVQYFPTLNTNCQSGGIIPGTTVFYETVVR